MRTAASLKADPYHGLDSRWSWITAAFCSWVMFMGTLSIRVSGVLFYGIVETFQVTREEASWPVTLNGSLLNLAGPVMGYLCRQVSCRSVLLICSLFTGVCVCVCYFAKGLLFLNIFFGVLHGVTLSGIFVGVNVLVSQHFEKSRNTACSLVFTITGLNTLVVPPLVEFFRATYGTRGAFLLLGALTLNTLPGAIVLRSPTWLTVLPQAEERCVKEAPPKATNGFATCNEDVPRREDHRPSRQARNGRVESPDRKIARLSRVSKLARSTVMDDWTGSVESFVVQDAAKTAEESPTRAKTLKETSRQFLTFSFCTIALSFSIIVFGMGTFILLSVDLAQDRGIAPYEAVYLLHAFTVGDIVFRALCGIVIDKGVLSLEAVMLTGYLVQAFAFELLVWSGTLPMMLLCSVLVGISNGSRISLQAPALINDFGVDTLPIMMGGMVFCIGFIALGRPLLIGYYRDKMGEYSGLLHILAVVNAVMFLVWSVRLLLKRRTAEPIKDDPILRNTNEPLLESHSVKVGEDS